MLAKKRRVYRGLMQRLKDEPYRFEFFQAVRLLLAHHRQHSAERDRDVLGQVIQFRSSVSLAFPPSEIESLDIEWDDDPGLAPDADEAGAPHKRFRRATLTPSFIGLTGPSGVLPRHYTQHVAERELYHRDTASRAFLDIFTSRAVALFYQSWLKYRLQLQYETDRRNHFLPLVLSLAGIGADGLRDRLKDGPHGISDESLAYYAGALQARPQSAQWFSRVSADYFRVPSRVEQFVGQWLALPDHELTRLGSLNCLLGKTAFCGARVWNRETRLRLTLGPLRRTQFDAFLPGGPAFDNLRRLFRLLIGVSFDCEVRLILDKRDVTPSRLVDQGRTRLGWDCWIQSRESSSDSSDTAYLIEAAGCSQFC